MPVSVTHGKVELGWSKNKEMKEEREDEEGGGGVGREGEGGNEEKNGICNIYNVYKHSHCDIERLESIKEKEGVGVR